MHIVYAGNRCSVGTRGDTFQWAIALCEVRSGTDDYESPEVQACLRRLASHDKINPKSGINCKLNVRYKKDWCKPFVDMGKQPTIDACVRSEQAVPGNVRNGFVGEE
jgi:hypothetical protein